MGSNKKLYGYYPTTPEWLPIKVDANGKVVISGGIPQYLIAKWDYVYGAIPTGWSLYESGGYSTDKCTGGTASATCNYATYYPSLAFDNDEVTYWTTYTTCYVPNLYLRYDFGAGVSHAIVRVRLKAHGNGGFKAFVIQGSNNGSAWTTLGTFSQAGNESWQNFDFTNSVAYRYIQCLVSESYNIPGVVEQYEVEILTLAPAWIIKN